MLVVSAEFFFPHATQVCRGSVFCDACSFLARIPAWFCFHSKVFGAVATATATATATYLYGGGVLVAALVVLLFDEVSVVVFCTFCFVVALLRIKRKTNVQKAQREKLYSCAFSFGSLRLCCFDLSL